MCTAGTGAKIERGMAEPGDSNTPRSILAPHRATHHGAGATTSRDLTAHPLPRAEKRGPRVAQCHAQAPEKERKIRSQTAEQQVKKIADDTDKTRNKTHDSSPYEGLPPAFPRTAYKSRTTM